MLHVRVMAAALMLGAAGTTVLAQEPRAFNLIGAGAVVSQSPYRDVDTKSWPVPFLSVEYKDFYIKGIETGYRIVKTDGLTVSVIAAPRFMGYDSGDSDTLAGMEDRRPSLDAGIKAAYDLPWEGTSISARAVADTLDRSRGSEYGLALEREFRGGIFRLVPSLGLKYASAQLTGYYYGVRTSEERAGRPAYDPKPALNPYAGLMLACGVSKRLVVVTRLTVESLADTVRNSPIVDRSRLWSGAVGLTWRF